jgi:hypothetical protein
MMMILMVMVVVVMQISVSVNSHGDADSLLTNVIMFSLLQYYTLLFSSLSVFGTSSHVSTYVAH